MDNTTANEIVFGGTPTTEAAAFRWLEAAITWHGHKFEGDDAALALTLVTSFHWDTRGADMTATMESRFSAVYDRNVEAAFAIIDQTTGDAYEAAVDVQPCHHCDRLVQWRDDGGWRHVDSATPGCFLIPTGHGWDVDA